MDVAYEFATDVPTGQTNNRIILQIKNPKRRGFRAGRLSKFQEDEVILSGQLKIIDWSMSANVAWTGKNIKDKSMTRDDWLDIADGKLGLADANIQIPWNMEDTSKFIDDVLKGDIQYQILNRPKLQSKTYSIFTWILHVNTFRR